MFIDGERLVDLLVQYNVAITREPAELLTLSNLNSTDDPTDLTD